MDKLRLQLQTNEFSYKPWIMRERDIATHTVTNPYTRRNSSN